MASRGNVPGVFGGSSIGVRLAIEYGLQGGVFIDPGQLGGRIPAGSGRTSGRFTNKTGVSSELNALNHGFEQALRERWSDLAHAGGDRPRTGRLEAAIRNPRNGTLTGPAQTGFNFGFGVGIPGWLDQQAKYWRIIEYGSRDAAPNWLGPMVDKSGVPLFVTNGRVGKRGQPRAFQRSGGMWAPGPMAYTKGVTSGKLSPASAGLRKKLFERGWRAPYRAKPILAREHHQRAWDEVMGPNAERYFAQLKDVVLPALGVSAARARQIVAQNQSKRV